MNCIVLGIETSCDDTSAGVWDGRALLSNVVSTQLVHRNFGGIVPELASRSHIQLIIPVIGQALDQAGCPIGAIQAVAVTYGPGLAGSLLVGLSTAKGLALSLNIPFIGVNHLEGHIWANALAHPDLEPPFVTLIASGGHTQLVFVRAWGEYRILGRTRDDAAGEAFDKVGKLLEVGFPGGPAIEKLAKSGNSKSVKFPRAFLEEGSLDFSFSGIKTAVLNHVQKSGAEEVRSRLADIAAAFQAAVIDVLVAKTLLAAEKTHVRRVCLAGGVAVNKALQERMAADGSNLDIRLFFPPPALCADNGGMIARAGAYHLERSGSSPFDLAPNPSLNF
jgi:N6-L-threonylcarbamoyladenine synthase